MPIPSINFHNLEPIDQYYDQGPGYENILSNMLKGYGMSREPARMRAEEEKNMLANKLKEQEYQYNPEYYGERNKGLKLKNADQEFSNMLNQRTGKETADLELEKLKQDIELNKARTLKEREQAKRGGGNYAPSNYTKQEIEYENEVAKNGPDSEKAQRLKAKIEKDAGLAETMSVKGQRQKAKAANVAREHLLKVKIPPKYLSSFGETEVLNDLSLYNTKNPKKQKEVFENLVQFGLANKVLPELTSENIIATMGRGTEAERKEWERISTQGWPKWSHTIANRLPEDVQNEINRRHDVIVPEITRLKSESVQDIYRKPKQEAKESKGDTIKMFYKDENGKIWKKDIPRDEAGKAAEIGWFENEK